jgi:hypothetical protein
MGRNLLNCESSVRVNVFSAHKDLLWFLKGYVKIASTIGVKTRVKNQLSSLSAEVVKDLFGTRDIETIM